jgi:hypothetical protein
MINQSTELGVGIQAHQLMKRVVCESELLEAEENSPIFRTLPRKHIEDGYFAVTMGEGFASFVQYRLCMVGRERNVVKLMAFLMGTPMKIL